MADFTADSIQKIGWGGRIADALQTAGANPSATVSMGISIAGNNVFLAGRNVIPFTIMRVWSQEAADVGARRFERAGYRCEAYTDVLALQSNPTYSGRGAMRKAFADITQRAICVLTSSRHCCATDGDYRVRSGGQFACIAVVHGGAADRVRPRAAPSAPSSS